jgi:type II secretory pathway pseudopilin PulG
MLTVIAVIAVLASLIFPVIGAVEKRQTINHAQAEMAQLETAIERYKAAYGFYPPDNPDPKPKANQYINQLYFELEGTTYSNGVYTTLDGSAWINSKDLNTVFGPGVNGIMNCTRPGGGEDSAVARNFLPDLKSKQELIITNANGTYKIIVIITSVGGPDAGYVPLGVHDANPWRYNSSSPTNNPGAYDLWIQLSIGSTINSGGVIQQPSLYLICNWSKQAQYNLTNWP